MGEDGLIRLRRRRATTSAATILLPLLDFTFVGLIVGGASLTRFALASGLATTKGTSDIVSTDIARVG